MSQNCGNCAAWGGERKQDVGQRVGTCRAGPPQPYQGSSDSVRPLTFYLKDPVGTAGVYVPRGFWPWTFEEDWCAFHR